MKAVKSIFAYRAVIFDVDGTLYHQAPLRRLMAWKLLWYLVRNPHRLIELKIVRTFRILREKGDFPGQDLETEQYQAVADHLALPFPQVKEVIEKWMYQLPLPYLHRYRDEQLIQIILGLRSRGILTIAYSDYPAVDKLAAMKHNVDHVFSAVDPLINCLKPDSRGLQAILNHLKLSPNECLFVGDRDEKDGLCARAVGTDFFILPHSKNNRKRCYSRPPFTS